jgi:hypothetical protein
MTDTDDDLPLAPPRLTRQHNTRTYNMIFSEWKKVNFSTYELREYSKNFILKHFLSPVLERSTSESLIPEYKKTLVSLRMFIKKIHNFRNRVMNKKAVNLGRILIDSKLVEVHTDIISSYLGQDINGKYLIIKALNKEKIPKNLMDIILDYTNKY